MLGFEFRVLSYVQLLGFKFFIKIKNQDCLRSSTYEKTVFYCYLPLVLSIHPFR